MLQAQRTTQEVYPMDLVHPAYIGRTHTLLYGYTLDRMTYHVCYHRAVETRPVNTAAYISVLVYNNREQQVISEFAFLSGAANRVNREDFEEEMQFGSIKRLYPERCDFYACSKLKREYGIHLSFTNYTRIPDSHKGIWGLTGKDF